MSEAPGIRILPLVGLSLLAIGIVSGALWLGFQPTPIPTGGQRTERSDSTVGDHASAWPVSFDFPDDSVMRYQRVVLVTIDTLRADHVSSYGYKRKTTPFFDYLARRGALFQNVVSSVSHTAPSHASMLTGLPPVIHGVVENGYQLDPEAADLARIFGDAGCETAAFLSVKFLSGITWSFDFVDVKLQSGRPVVDSALAWLKMRRQTDRFFLWVHLYDPHRWKEKERAPRGELTAIRNATKVPDGVLYSYLAKLHGLPDPEGEELDLGWTPEIKGQGRIETKTKRDYLDLVDSYDAMVLFADRQVARLYQGVEDLNLPGATLWVITSDHGEGLASHGIAGHGSRIYQEQLRVPLLIHATDGSVPNRSIAELVQLVDVYPTLVAAVDARLQGLDSLLYGASLWPLIDGTGGWIARPAFSQRKPMPDAAEGEPEELYSLQTDHYKYLLHVPGDDEFFDLKEDPRELQNLASQPGRERDALHNLLQERLEIFQSTHRATTGEIPAEWAEELRDLGYAQ